MKKILFILLICQSTYGQHYISVDTSKIATIYDVGLKMTNPLTTNGDLIYQHGGVPTRVGAGNLNQCLQVGPDDGDGKTLVWADREWKANTGIVYNTAVNVGIGNSSPSQLLEVGSTSAGGNVTVNATLGAEMVTVPMVSGGWTLGGGWSISAGVLSRTTSGGWTAATAASGMTAPTAGTTYKITIVISAFSGSGGVYYEFGGVRPYSYGVTMTTTGTMTDYITAVSTAKIAIYANGADAVSITSVSVQPVTSGTGDITAVGHIKFMSPLQNDRGQNIMSFLHYPAMTTKINCGTGSDNNYFTLGPNLLQYGSTLGISTLNNGPITITANGPGALTLNGGATGSVAINGTNSNIPITFGKSGGEGMRFTGGNLGIGTTSPSYILSLSGQAAQTFGMERMTTSNTAGNSLTLRAGGATSGATDKLGGPLYYYPGISTGNATGISHQWYTYDAGSTGTTDQTATAKMTMTSAGKIGIGTTAPTTKLHIDSTGAAVKIDPTNALRLEGTATVWNDLMYPFESGANAGTGYPTFVADSNYYTFVVDTTGASKCVIYMTVQMPHWWKEGTTIYPHCHYKHQTAVGTPNFIIKYKWVNIGAATNSAWSWYRMGSTTSITDNAHAMSYGSGGISGTGKTISSLLLVQLYLRTTPANVNAYQLDFHVEQDALGSNTETSKN